MGQVCGNVNRNLKWAFVEIGNLIVINQRRLAGTHVVRLYQRIKRAKNHRGRGGAPLGRSSLVDAHHALTKEPVASFAARGKPPAWVSAFNSLAQEAE